MGGLQIPGSLFIAKNNKKISYSPEIEIVYFHSQNNEILKDLKKIVENFDEIHLFQNKNNQQHENVKCYIKAPQYIKSESFHLFKQLQVKQTLYISSSMLI